KESPTRRALRARTGVILRMVSCEQTQEEPAVPLDMLAVTQAARLAVVILTTPRGDRAGQPPSGGDRPHQLAESLKVSRQTVNALEERVLSTLLEGAGHRGDA